MGKASLPHDVGLDDLEWLRALAARLVRDPHTAEDAVQDTLVAALAHGPRRGTLRAWLARVLRNALRQEWRARGRRAEREAASAPRAEAPTPHEVVAELALHRRLAAEVEALAEPYRTAILLRYLRGRESAEIARELGLPVKTVRTRIERGLAQLRARLGRDREAWLACLALVQPREAALPPVPWLLPMKLQLVSAVAALSLLGTYLALRDDGQDVARDEPRPDAPASAATTASVAPAPEVARSPQRSELPTGNRPEPTASPAPLVLVRGSVRTFDGAGVALTVAFEPDDGAGGGLRVSSDAQGRFELPLPAARGRLGTTDPYYSCVVAPRLEGALPLSGPIVVVAPAADYGGSVHTPDGTPLGGAELAITLPGPIVQSRDVGGSTVHVLVPFAETTSDEHGRFRFDHVGLVAGAELTAEADGYDPARLPLPERSTPDLDVVLAPSAEARMIHGLVLHATGAPAAGALVSLGQFSVPCAADGTFVIERESWRKEGWLRAVAPGTLPAELQLAAASRPSSPADPIVLALGGPARSLRGRVRDQAGDPVPFAEVFSPDTTPFGHVVGEVADHEVTGETTLEPFLAGRSGPGLFTAGVRADASGRFELRGLLARPYALFALDPRTLAAAGPVAAVPGPLEVELRLGPSPLVRVAGRVVSRSGRPLPGVAIRPGRSLEWQPDEAARKERWAGFLLTPPGASCSVSEPACLTDADGRFDLGSIALEGTHLSLSGPALVLGAVHTIGPHDDPGALAIVVEAASRFEIMLRRRDEADAFSLLDADGKRVILFLEVEGLTITAVRAAIDGGRSGTVLVKEGEYELVFHRGAEEIRRERLQLEPGGLFELTF